MNFLLKSWGNIMVHWRAAPSDDKEAVCGWLILIGVCVSVLVLIFLSWGKLI